jgi:hypothetical protein
MPHMTFISLCNTVRDMLRQTTVLQCGAIRSDPMQYSGGATGETKRSQVVGCWKTKRGIVILAKRDERGNATGAVRCEDGLSSLHAFGVGVGIGHVDDVLRTLGNSRKNDMSYDNDATDQVW